MKLSKYISLIILFSSTSWSNTFLVTNALDSGPGSLREALTNANNTPGPNIINFSNDFTISPVTLLPIVTKQLTIDGSGHTIILDGAAYLSTQPPCPSQSSGDRRDPALVFSGANNSMVTGLKITNWCNGITVEGTSHGKWLNNYFSHNIGDAQLGMYAGSDYNTVENNIFMQDPDVFVGDHIELQGSSYGHYSHNKFVGGENAYELLVDFSIFAPGAGSDYNVIENENIEKCFRGSIELQFFNVGNIIRNNIIKDSSYNPSEIGFADGIHLAWGSLNNVIEGNVISNISSGNGIAIFGFGDLSQTSDGNVIKNNIIKNTALAGILVNDGVRNRLTGNIIQGINELSLIPSPTGIDLSDTFVNGQGFPDGVTQNNSGLMANNGQNYPVMNEAQSKWNNNLVLLKGTLDVASAPGQEYKVECFGNSTNVREAAVFLGSKGVVVGGLGLANITMSISINNPLQNGQTNMYVSCTATDAIGNTSELSAPIHLIKK